jgi:hypothetical protein
VGCELKPGLATKKQALVVGTNGLVRRFSYLRNWPLPSDSDDYGLNSPYPKLSFLGSWRENRAAFRRQASSLLYTVIDLLPNHSDIMIYCLL